MATGTFDVDFGAFPGRAAMKVAVADTGVATGSLIEVWPHPVATTDHSDTEHNIEDFDCGYENVAAGVGFDAVIHPRVGRCYGVYKFQWARS